MREVLSREQWTRRERAHQDRVSRWTEPFLERRSRGEKHPVEDFLFTYYTLKPGQFKRWHPGAGIILLVAPIVAAAGLDHSALGAFLATVPLNYYAWVALVLVGLLGSDVRSVFSLPMLVAGLSGLGTGALLIAGALATAPAAHAALSPAERCPISACP